MDFNFKQYAGVSRCIYRAHTLKPEKAAEYLKSKAVDITELIRQGKMLVFSAYLWGEYIFLYYECVNCDISPESLFSKSAEYFDVWDGRAFMPMIDVFHCNLPESIETWRRKTEIKPQARVIYLRPEMVSSYVFLHWQLQEETPGMDEKHFQISLHENMLFMYTETPGEHTKPSYAGKLTTHNSPDNWPVLMREHFKSWDDGNNDEWRDIDTIMSI